jgi:hypothetical protein
MNEILKTIFTNLWTFIGTIILLELILHLFVNLINRILRHWNIRKYGYPPSHCDADGDFKS